MKGEIVRLDHRLPTDKEPGYTTVTLRLDQLFMACDVQEKVIVRIEKDRKISRKI